MNLNFTKMHGLGNDFVIIDATALPIHLTTPMVRQWADRHTGVGFDQLLLLEPSQKDYCAFYYRIYNADGSEASQCGNGARCVARYAYDHHLVAQPVFQIQTRSGDLEVHLEADGLVSVNMGNPCFSPEAIPFVADKQQTTYALSFDGIVYEASVLSMGNPHCVISVNDVNTAPVLSLGAKIASSGLFPSGVNVGFMQIINPHEIKLRVLERGAGETAACGSGACAGVVAGKLQHKLNKKVLVSLPGGQLTITWQGIGHPVWMKGPTSYVFEGKLPYP